MAQPATSREAAPTGLLGVEEYLELQKDANVKYEYVGGTIHLQAGASSRHNRIGLNIAARLLNASRGGDCRVYTNDMKFRVAEDVFYYPDVMVACGPEPEDPYYETAPCLVVEVVSPGTAATDRREKLLAYRDVESVRAYLVVEQEKARVERHWRDDKGTWRRDDLAGEGRLAIPCPETEITLAEVYEGL